jgi:hypothetical protein
LREEWREEEDEITDQIVKHHISKVQTTIDLL